MESGLNWVTHVYADTHTLLTPQIVSAVKNWINPNFPFSVPYQTCRIPSSSVLAARMLTIEGDGEGKRDVIESSG